MKYILSDVKTYECANGGALMQKIIYRISALGFTISIGILFIAAEIPVVEAEPSAFFDYLHQASPRPTMVAYNPSNLNPDNLQISTNDLIKHIHKDLICLRSGFNGLVLYRYSPDITPFIVEQAESLGFRAILLGVWDVKSKIELTGVIGITKKYNDKIAFAVIVGNEGINDSRYSFADLDIAAETLKNAGLGKMKVPLATSEPMAKYGLVELRKFGDFLAPNIHPAIDRSDLNPTDAVSWVQGRAQALVQVAKKPVLIKETGFPNGGNPNYTPERQYAFWQAWHDVGAMHLTANSQQDTWISFAAVFEAFDSPWKAIKSGIPVEGHWGILNEYLRPYPAFEVYGGQLDSCQP